MTFCICQINLKSLHTLIIIYTTPNLFFFSKNLPCLCSSPCIYILLTNVLRASDLDTNTIQCSIFIYCWSEWVREREVIASCVCDCVRLLFMLLALTFSNSFNSFFIFFRGRISTLASTWNEKTFFYYWTWMSFKGFLQASERVSLS